MTLLQICVAGVQEALAALEGGADLVDFALNGRCSAYAAVKTAVAGHARFSFTLTAPGDAAEAAILAEDGSHRANLARALLLPDGGPPAGLTDINVLIDVGAGPDALARPLSPGIGGVVLDTSDGTRLLDHLDIAALGGLVRQCRDVGLRLGFGGALPAPDISRLLLLTPDFLRLRPASADVGLKRDAMRMIRDLVPRRAATGTPAEGQAPVETDRVFVREFVLPMSIGAYRGERGRPQRVGFSVEADVRRPSAPARDMRDIFSYDLIVDSIRLIAAEGHVDLVETLAEKIAAALLAHPRVVATRIRVEKLDVVEARIGIEISRRRRPDERGPTPS